VHIQLTPEYFVFQNKYMADEAEHTRECLGCYQIGSAVTLLLADAACSWCILLSIDKYHKSWNKWC